MIEGIGGIFWRGRDWFTGQSPGRKGEKKNSFFFSGWWLKAEIWGGGQPWILTRRRGGAEKHAEKRKLREKTKKERTEGAEGAELPSETARCSSFRAFHPDTKE